MNAPGPLKPRASGQHLPRSKSSFGMSRIGRDGGCDGTTRDEIAGDCGVAHRDREGDDEDVRSGHAPRRARRCGVLPRRIFRFTIPLAVE